MNTRKSPTASNTSFSANPSFNIVYIFLGLGAVLFISETLGWTFRSNPYVPTSLAPYAGQATSANGLGIDPTALSHGAAWTIWITHIICAAIGLIVIWQIHLVAKLMLLGKFLTPATAKDAWLAAKLTALWAVVKLIGTTMGNNLIVRDLNLGNITSFNQEQLTWVYLAFALLVLLVTTIRRELRLQADVEGLV